MSQDDPALISAIQADYIKEPDITQDYNFTLPVADLLEAAGGYDLPVDADQLVFKGQLRNGFFIEAGAGGGDDTTCNTHDHHHNISGEDDSNSLYFELKYNWTGLLIEPLSYDLQFKHRKSLTSSACLALEPRPHFADFNYVATVSDSQNEPVSMTGIVKEEGETTIKMQCMPLYSLILAAGNPTVNYFILDIEGAELQVLKTLPWDKVDIEVVSVETDLAGMVMEGSREEIIDLMISVGYTHADHSSSWSHVNNVPKDDMFIRNDIAARVGLSSRNKQEL